jgi:PAS domain S-box-containing protein
MIAVLHVDDDAGFLELAAELLVREDDCLEVTTAVGAAEGRELLAEGSFDCVVSDYDMPGENGIEFLESVREDHPKLPFILYTGEGGEAVASEAIGAGVTDYLQKGIGHKQYQLLANRIRNAVSARRSERAAERRRQRLEQTLKTVPSCVVRLNRAGEFTFANDRAVEVLGLERSAVTERRYNDPEWDIRDPDGEPIPDERLPFRRVLDSGEVLRNFRHTIEWPGGEQKVLLVNGAPVLDDDGEVQSVIFSLSDVTEQQRRKRELRETTARLEGLFENSPDMINVHDTDGTIVDVNRRLCEETGYGEAELVGRKVWEIDRDITPERARTLWEGMSVGDQRRIEGAFRRRDGSTFPVEVHIRRLGMDGEECFAVISRDISDRKQYERELERQNERLEEFASVVSHDLRNPLMVASSYLEMLRDGRDEDALDSIERALDRMDTLIDDLLTLARNGEVVAEFEPVDLAAAAGNCWATVDTGGATLAVDTGLTVSADRSRLRQLLENLFGNAVTHGGDGVTVTVGDLPGGFYVADDGPGIPEGDREAVFTRGHSTTREGTGFGLAIVTSIAEAHGWEISLTESDQGGARFEITGVDMPAPGRD